MVFSETALQMADVLMSALQPWIVVTVAGVCGEAFGQGFQLPFQAAPFQFQIRQARFPLLECLLKNFLQALSILAHLRDLLHDHLLHPTSWDGLRRAMIPASLQSVGADVIAIALAALARISWSHGASARPAMQKPFENRPGAVSFG